MNFSAKRLGTGSYKGMHNLIVQNLKASILLLSTQRYHTNEPDYGDVERIVTGLRSQTMGVKKNGRR